MQLAMVALRYISILGVILFIPLLLHSQKGPGGVSIETNNWQPIDSTGFPPSPQSTCRIWLDAGSLTGLADGDDVSIWPDISHSYYSDDAVMLASELPPYYRNDAANSINGFPVVTFEEGRFLQLFSSVDLNLDYLTTTKTAFFAFRTATDVNTKQVIYEEGGCARGYNVYISNGFLYVGAYDLNIEGINNPGTGGWHSNGRDPDNTPQWGYTFVRTPVLANSTYVLATQFSAPDTAVIHNNTFPNPEFYIRGWLNGQVFDQINYTDGNQTNNLGANALTPYNGIGTLWAHPDPIGLGAVNTAVLDADGRNCDITGQRPFQGRFAEFCYYNDLLSQTERIIVQNYLASKYFANNITDSKYAHKGTYGVEVIGIGQETNIATNRHLKSQGRNPFEISAAPAQMTSANQYFLTGHNNLPMKWSSTQVPASSPNIKRLQRIWRVDETGPNMGAIHFKVDTMDLPVLPAGFTKMVLLLDETNANFPNFALESTKVLELYSADGRNFSIDYDFPDNSFFTLAMLRPTVNFALVQQFAVEGNTPPANFAVQALVRLNYTPSPLSSGFTVDYFFVEETATNPADFSYNPAVQGAGLYFAPGQQSANIPFTITNDNIAEDPATESFLVVLHAGLNTTSGLNIGQRDTLLFQIYDNDSPPVAVFELSQSSVLENVPSVIVKVLRVGDPAAIASTTSQVAVARQYSPNQGTATYGVDYTMQNALGWFDYSGTRVRLLTFAPGQVEATVEITIFDDEKDEFDETVNLFLYPWSNITIDATNFTHQLTIVNDDPLPNARFFANSQNGFESVGNPIIFIELDRPSAKDVEVGYQILPSSTATIDQDYTITTPGVVQFPPDSLQAWPNLLVLQDLLDEPDETVVFDLVQATTVNANIGSPSQHTYTIIDYAPFEWRGAGGVGRESDNIVWIDADRMSGGHNDLMQSISNFSPRNIDILQNSAAHQAALQTTSNLINSRKTLQFDGSDYYELSKHPQINQSGSYERKSYFFVVRTGPNVTNTQMLYSQGHSSGSRGLSIYIQGGQLYFNVWNRNTTPAWGTTVSGTLSRYARSHAILPNTNYIISCHFDRNATEKITVYINGRKGQITELADCGIFMGDNDDPCLGRLVGTTRLHNMQVSGNDYGFAGYLAEVIMYSNPQFNPTRRAIVENYLSAKYDIELITNTPQLFEPAFADAGSPTFYFGHQAAGVGIGANITDDLHLDGQGPAQLRVKLKDTSLLNSYAMWGHNNVPLNHSYPYSTNLPTGVVERSGRVWKVFKSANLQELDLLLNFSGILDAPVFEGNELKILYHTNSNPQDFSNAIIVNADTIRSGPVVEFNNLNFPSGSYIALATTSSILPLPVQLLHFQAKLVSAGVQLNWATASEQNSDYFEVQRMGEGAYFWHAVARVPGAGNSNTYQYYDALDEQPLYGTSYYRLKQVDFDGKFTYSDPVAISNGHTPNGPVIILYPNPSYSGKVNMRTNGIPTGLPLKVSISSMAGSELWKAHFQLEDSGDVELHYGSLAPGMYLLKVQSTLFSKSVKLIIQ